DREVRGQYEYYSCLESVPIPMTATSEDGKTLKWPDGEANQCDAPQYIYSSCEAGPRVARRINDQGTVWVLLCRKNSGGWQSGLFNDIALIGHNPKSGNTCFFQNHLTGLTDGTHVPHPGDSRKASPESRAGEPDTFKPNDERYVQDVWLSGSVEGGIGSSI